jgi:hypothetical protein
MKLLPMGKKSLLYLTIYGSVVRFLCPQLFSVSLKHLFGQFSALTNSLYFFPLSFLFSGRHWFLCCTLLLLIGHLYS